ncbi:MAG TPA: hypothetical protein GX532_02035 [Clostridia bacterium]|jgi:spore cortex biosynthesis protein YabQ|nr:hypothetical protein [Clostridia bacterium]
MFVLEQALVFALVTVWGSFVGVILDCFRTLRRIWRPKSWGTSLGDVVFWLLVTAFTYFFLMLITWGEVRFYIFLGMGLGLYLYLKFCSKIISKFLGTVFFFGQDLFLFLVGLFSKWRNSSKPPSNPPQDVP